MFFSLKNIHLNLGDFHLEDVSFDIEQGDYLSIIGHTGSGKSILLESISGFYQPNKGHIFLEGKDIIDVLPEKRHISIVYQDHALLPHFTVFKNIAYGLKKMHKTGIQEKVNEIAKSLQIDHILHRKPKTLSGGEQQRTALARSLVVNPKLLLMDEPFSALDPLTSQYMRTLLKEVIQRKKTTVIHVTHNLDDVWSMANKAAFLYKGKLLQFDSKEQIFQKPNCQRVADFVETSLFEGVVVEQNNNTCVVRLESFDLISCDYAREGSKVKVAVRPENIAISKSRPANNSTNVIKARIKDVHPKGVIGTLLLEAGKTIIPVHSTSSTLSQLDPSPQDRVYLSVDFDCVRIIQDSNGVFKEL